MTTLLVANRGEIARRIFRTCDELGITTVAVYSDPDEGLQRFARTGVRLPGASPSETYLRGDLIIEAARAAGADAIHPGYGFLSENAAFARAVQEAGLIWIGPPPAAIEAMASKVEAKRLMEAAGVPVLPQMTIVSTAGLGSPVSEEHDPLRSLAPQGKSRGKTAGPMVRFPVMIKASAGGGGRGMRIANSARELAELLPLASAEAQSAFGDGTVFIEPYLGEAHHIEVQILADNHGTVWALGERECSIQRRHQKVIEETPSPLVERTPGLRQRLFEAAIAAAKAVSYVGAGTVEFLVSGQDIYFLEMNTRLQVEHPVTEAVTGLDLVALQIGIAGGSALPLEPPAPRGHAIEARLYAESDDFTPQSGPLYRFDLPASVRVDAGYTCGDVVSVHYDAMLAKVIAHAPNRTVAAAKLAGALKAARVHGVGTNRDLLLGVLRHPRFLDGTANTSFLESHVEEVVASKDQSLPMLAAALWPPVGWRNVRSQPEIRRFDTGEIAFHIARDGVVTLSAPDENHAIRLVQRCEQGVTIEVDGVRHRFDIAAHGDLVCVDWERGSASFRKLPRFTDPAESVAPGTLSAPMPATVIEVLVAEGDTVEARQPLLRLEAMKMQHTITAPSTGVITQLSVRIGQQVDAGAPLIVVSEES